MFYALIDHRPVKLKALTLEMAMAEIADKYPAETNPNEPVPIFHVISEMRMDVDQYRKEKKNKKKHDPEFYDLGGEG